MTKLEIYKGLAVVLFFPFIFGCLVAKSNLSVLMSINNSEPMTVKIDSLTRSHTGSSGSGQTNITAHFAVNKTSHTVNFTADGANYSDYVEKDSVKIWFMPNLKSGILRDINPTKEAWRKRYLNYLFIWPAGILMYPFLIILPLFLWEKRKQKSKKAKEG